eukprot:2989788-Rhodomonas_salina.3
MAGYCLTYPPMPYSFYSPMRCPVQTGTQLPFLSTYPPMSCLLLTYLGVRGADHRLCCYPSYAPTPVLMQGMLLPVLCCAQY